MSKEVLLMRSLEEFYLDKNNISILLQIVQGESKISLRVIDWFVTNYSKKLNIFYLINSTNDNIIFNHDDIKKLTYQEASLYRQFVVYIDYKLQLKAYQKERFDPFCRRDRIEFYYTEDEYFYTTVGQLNFFRWAITNHIIEYVEAHLKEIEMDMNKCYKAIYSQNKKDKSAKSVISSNDSSTSEEPLSSNSSITSSKSSGSRRRRQELSTPALKSLNRYTVNVCVSFD